MSAATTMVSIGGTGVFNREVPEALAEVWLDEFFMKRISVLRRTNTPERVMQSLGRQPECSTALLLPLAAHGIRLVKWDDLTPAQHAEIGSYFDTEISPALTPLVFDPAHPFPFLSNLSISLAFLLRDPRF